MCKARWGWDRGVHSLGKLFQDSCVCVWARLPHLAVFFFSKTVWLVFLFSKVPGILCLFPSLHILLLLHSILFFLHAGSFNPPWCFKARGGIRAEESTNDGESGRGGRQARTYWIGLSINQSSQSLLFRPHGRDIQQKTVLRLLIPAHPLAREKKKWYIFFAMLVNTMVKTSQKQKPPQKHH